MRGARAVAAALGVAAAGAATLAAAQRVDPKRATTLTVGSPRGASTAARVDGKRTGFARTALPNGTLKVAWTRSAGASLDGPPLVGARGEILLATGRGEVLTLDPDDGLERPSPPGTVGGGLLGAAPLGAAALLSDRTVVYMTAAGDAIGARDGALRFRTRVGDGKLVTERSGVLPMGDGGVAVASGTELATLDAEGHVRARASLDEPVAAGLIAVPGKVAAVTASGRVLLWAPGREPVRAGSFGGPVDGGAALEGDHTLVAVVGQQLVALDLDRGVATTRMASPGGLLLGPPALGGDGAHLLAAIPGRTFALAIDASGQETARVAVVTNPAAALSPDGGPALPFAGPHTGVLVDAAGTVAFGTPDGRVGVLTRDGALELLGDPVCLRAAGLGGRGPSPAPIAAAFAGLAPAGPGAFLVACDTGAVLKVIGPTGGSPLGAL